MYPGFSHYSMNMDLTFKLKVLNLDLLKHFLACNSLMNRWHDHCVLVLFDRFDSFDQKELLLHVL